ncbi:YihY/virulence factor BrkB family protein [Paractinoplanes toevensis]|uniref:YihY/virulence factor BrkB family protein n=1 Tax=Paractinoplanes toevensis TaxID=571911 RepID=UPI001BB37353|nr:YhjD/YihY/BrkB family envelope integrity protein [Actinoplanes toevensis]
MHRLDGVQRRHAFLGFPWAVFRKYLDDDGARLAAQLTYYGFLSLFPLLLLATAAVTELLQRHPELQSRMLDRLVSTALRPDIERAIADLPSSVVPLTVGLIGLLFAGTGGVLAVYSALNRMWGVPWRDRFGVARRYARVLFVLVLSFAAAVLATGSAVVTEAVLRLPAVERGAAGIGSAVAVFAVIVIVHKVLVCRPVRLRDVWVGGAVAATGITVLLHAAGTVLPVLVTRAGPVYGSFATVVGVFALFYLVSQTFVVGVEISTVLEQELSPRGLTDSDLTEPDRRALVLLARRQERVAGQHITTTFSAGGM